MKSEGRSAVFCGDTTRKWQQGPRALDQESPFLQFWGQMIRWAAGRASDVEAMGAQALPRGYRLSPLERVFFAADDVERHGVS